MFTFGLFSTHMPYVVMVVFYVFYFLFAALTPAPLTTNDASQLQNRIEWTETKIQSPNQIYNWYFGIEKNDNSLILCFKFPEKEKTKSPPGNFTTFEGFSNIFFNRPPPVFS